MTRSVVKDVQLEGLAVGVNCQRTPTLSHHEPSVRGLRGELEGKQKRQNDADSSDLFVSTLLSHLWGISSDLLLEDDEVFKIMTCC